MRIEKIYLREVGPFDEVEIELPPGTKDDAADVYLLTGPNGCGKSTILYAIAALVEESVDDRLLRPRFRSENSHALLIAGGVTWGLDGSSPHKSIAVHGGTNFRPMPSLRQWKESRFQWASFAYSGGRAVEGGRVAAVGFDEGDPFKDRLSFHQSANSSALVQWIANQEFRRLRAQAAGQPERAAAIADSVRSIETAIGEIIDDPSFAFVQGDGADLDVRVRRHGVVLDMDVLPDGLKSIVSWIADLLMRLDRIPWVDDIPPMQRSFLLLLDEIDIHLHPAWQRKVLPVVQRLFPKAQIIASTHSPFVVASADDAHIVALDVKDGVARLDKVYPSQRGKSYGAILHSIFGITSDFDTDTEALFDQFRAQRNLVLADPAADRTELDRLAAQLSQRGAELTELVRIELQQINRLRRQATAP